ncbi:MAG: hypothetical protein DHS20C11_07510 [Lysobacteraceae bacterium]|nr:MAG: hypothetical protein DHS20C11_07510 [Xanthomonadaceae bacterium]
MAQTIDIKVPDIGDFSDIPVIEVLAAEGDTVEAEQSLITLESDKATMEVPAPANGKIVSMTVKVGDNVSEGVVIGSMEVADDASADEPEEDNDQSASEPAQAEAEPKPEPKKTPAAESKASDDDKSAGPSDPPVPHDPSELDQAELPHASPSVRRFARELGVDLKAVNGTGPKGRILREDVQGFVKSSLQSGGAGQATGGGLSVLAAPKVDFSKFGEVESQPLSRIKKISGANLHRNWVTIPHVTQHDEADITDMEAFRKGHAEQAAANGTKLTPVVFLMKACVAALKKFPHFNASLDESGENLVIKKYFHIGVAVDTPDGLVVPVIRDVDQKSIFELAAELVEASGKARAKKLSPTDMQGGSMSISSLGGIGGTAFTPIVNAPEVVILGVSRSRMTPVWNGESFQPRLMLPLSLSYDHRVVDGADAARFTAYIGWILSDIRRVLL